MIHRIINWITNPFKKKTETHEPEENFPKFKIPEHQPLSQEQVNQIKADLINAVKEFREKNDLDVLTISRVSDEAKKEIISLIKEDLKEKEYPMPALEQPSTQAKKKTSSKKKKNFNEKKSE